MNDYTITKTFVGTGKDCRKVYHVYNMKGEFCGQYYSLDAAISSYPHAIIN